VSSHRAWRYRGGALTAADVPAPALKDDQIRVEVEAAVFGAPERAAAELPVTPGGCAVGVVREAGAAASDLVGRRVVVGPEQPDPESDVCRRGGAAACDTGEYLGRTADGCLAQTVVARARWALTLAEPVEVAGPHAALIGREAAHAFAMFTRAGVGPGEPVVIVGSDVIARFLIQVAVAKGTRPMVLFGDRAWADWATERGAVPVQTSGTDTRAAVLEAARAGGHGQRPWRVFETTASDVGRLVACSLPGPGGTLVLLARRAVGEVGAGPPLMLDPVLDRGCMVLGIAGAHPDLLPEVAALAVRGDLDLAGAATEGALPEVAAHERGTYLVRP
jgi:D-arabinose 1-dehydrogenase-like Zn-dependent alcohol dehydrogenase